MYVRHQARITIKDTSAVSSHYSMHLRSKPIPAHENSSAENAQDEQSQRNLPACLPDPLIRYIFAFAGGAASGNSAQASSVQYRRYLAISSWLTGFGSLKLGATFLLSVRSSATSDNADSPNSSTSAPSVLPAAAGEAGWDCFSSPYTALNQLINFMGGFLAGSLSLASSLRTHSGPLSVSNLNPARFSAGRNSRFHDTARGWHT
ncbi:hypothetical protein MPH_03637 [Macrophomina phaseolina MS6]|uniref:Uncharacterized protein n=1 Tax=Macrophomina phaseolina (strain MS6) TaxID=1126212 RepID=K2R9F8_MACPH|nr:hypothetical protein MPH_03637 [Macrophomina phaseolina MS6]